MCVYLSFDSKKGGERKIGNLRVTIKKQERKNRYCSSITGSCLTGR